MSYKVGSYTATGSSQTITVGFHPILVVVSGDGNFTANSKTVKEGSAFFFEGGMGFSMMDDNSVNNYSTMTLQLFRVNWLTTSSTGFSFQGAYAGSWYFQGSSVSINYVAIGY